MVTNKGGYCIRRMSGKYSRKKRARKRNANITYFVSEKSGKAEDTLKKIASESKKKEKILCTKKMRTEEEEKDARKHAKICLGRILETSSNIFQNSPS